MSVSVTVSESSPIIQVTNSTGDAVSITLSSVSSSQVSSQIDNAINSLVDSAPESLNTLHELAAALNNDENFGLDTIGSISNLNSATGQLSTATGLLVQKSETGNFITDSDTGAFYAASNPSGFIDAADLSSYVQDSETGLFLVSGEDAVVNNFTTLSNVGIKINTPSAELDVNGSVKIRGTLDMTDNGILNSTYNGGSF